MCCRRARPSILEIKKEFFLTESQRAQRRIIFDRINRIYRIENFIFEFFVFFVVKKIKL